jgi:hypothetical protein
VNGLKVNESQALDDGDMLNLCDRVNYRFEYPKRPLEVCMLIFLEEKKKKKEY